MRLLRNLADFWLMAFSRYVNRPDTPPEPTWTDGNP